MNRRKHLQSESLDRSIMHETNNSFQTNPYSRDFAKKYKGKLYKSSAHNRAHTSVGELNSRRLSMAKPKSMILIKKNNESIKYPVADQRLRNPSIPCKFVTHTSGYFYFKIC